MDVTKERIYCAEQIKVPDDLPNIMKDYTKELIKSNPVGYESRMRRYLLGKAFFSRIRRGRPETLPRRRSTSGVLSTSRRSSVRSLSCRKRHHDTSQEDGVRKQDENRTTRTATKRCRRGCAVYLA
ncbi:unnamed protein product [Amoebophrya sp. A120]|nr:unnamed protein product [Amoebophrya sp. A120]|eukprot:GSA120T00016545001.1